MIQTVGLKKFFGSRVVLKGIDLCLRRSEITLLTGPNGAGKTTLLDCLSGFQKPDAGAISINGNPISNFKPGSFFRSGVCRTFQGIRLIPDWTVDQNLQFAALSPSPAAVFRIFSLHCANESFKSKNERLLEDLGLLKTRHSYVGTLSVGQQKLLSIACCLATQAQYLLLDEPFAALSEASTDKLTRTLVTQQKLGRSMLIVDHRTAAIQPHISKQHALQDGRLELL